MSGFEADFFANNRRQLGQKLHGGVVVLAGQRQMQRRSDVAYPFEQDANFWYLTGLNQPRLQMIYDSQRDRCWVIIPELSAVEQTFEGSIDQARLLKQSGADEVIVESQIEEVLRQIARQHSAAYTLNSPGAGALVTSPASRELTQRLERIFTSVQDCKKELTELRAIKQPAELKAIERAVRLTTDSFAAIKQRLGDFTHEYEIEAEFSYRFGQKQARHAYEPIVAAGANACTLHYIDNNAKLKNGNLVLIDVGAQVDGYAADITRTYAYGQLTKRRAELHDALQQAHQSIIDSIAPNMPVIEYQKTVDKLMGEALIAVGLSTDGREADVRTYMPHAVSHGLGLDVHDSLGGTKLLRPGMVLTVEPGIYLAKESIGIRIEDDILITDKGVRNLSKNLSTDWR